MKNWENGCAIIFGTVFWYALTGVPFLFQFNRKDWLGMPWWLTYALNPLLLALAITVLLGCGLFFGGLFYYVNQLVCDFFASRKKKS